MDLLGRSAMGAVALALAAASVSCSSPGGPSTSKPVTAACSAGAIKKGLAANGGLSQVSGWQVQSYACEAGWAMAAVVAPSVHPPLYAVLRQTARGWASERAVDAVCFPPNAAAVGRTAHSSCPRYVLPPSSALRALLRKIGPLTSGAA